MEFADVIVPRYIPQHPFHVVIQSAAHVADPPRHHLRRFGDPANQAHSAAEGEVGILAEQRNLQNETVL